MMDTTTKFFFGCFLAGVIAAITVGWPCFKDQLKVGNHETKVLEVRIRRILYYLIYSLLHVTNMLMIMTMNTWVLMFILIGATLSYFAFASKQNGGGLLAVE
jgi:hypothetical protein